MNNHYWNQQQGDAQNARPLPSINGNGNGVPKSGSLLRNYSPQPQGWPTPQRPSPVSPIPPSSPHSDHTRQQQYPQSPQQFPQGPQQEPQQNWPAQQGGGPASVFASAMNTMRRWSGKMAAARGGYVEPNPPGLYRPQAAQPVKKHIPWKRSHALRVSMQMRHRRARWQNTRPNNKKVLIVALSIFAALLVVLLSSGFGAAYAYYQSEFPRVQELANQQIAQSTRIYDRNFKLIYTAYNGQFGRSTAITYNIWLPPKTTPSGRIRASIRRAFCARPQNIFQTGALCRAAVVLSRSKS